MTNSNSTDTYELESTDCPLCGSSQARVYIRQAKELYIGLDEHFDVCECLNCSHRYTNPRPSKETIGYFYPDEAGYYQPQHYDEPSGAGYEAYKAMLHRNYNYPLSSTAGKIRSFLHRLLKNRSAKIALTPDYIPSGKLLDIGCSYGLYLQKMKSLGWEVYGTELNKAAVEFARVQAGLTNVTQGFFEDIPFEPAFFDTVVMSMVLEHVYEPNLSIAKVGSIIRPNGQLIVSVPDISGFEATQFMEHNYALQVPQHLQHFSPGTLSSLLSSHGFTVEGIYHHRVDRDLVASAYHADKKMLYKLLSAPLIRKTVVKAFVLLLSLLGRTSRMTIYARKTP